MEEHKEERDSGRTQNSGHIRSRGCVVSQQFVDAQPRCVRDLPELLRRRLVNAVHPVRHRHLAYPDSLRECRLSRVRSLKIGAQSLHSPESIGLPYFLAIGHPYVSLAQNLPMAKTRERTFLERALEALRDRYPRERPTQVRLAKIAGVSQPAVHEWGIPGRAPEHSSVLKLAKELNVCVGTGTSSTTTRSARSPSTRSSCADLRLGSKGSSHPCSPVGSYC
jgi:hypothetical protein